METRRDENGRKWVETTIKEIVICKTSDSTRVQVFTGWFQSICYIWCTQRMHGERKLCARFDYYAMPVFRYMHCCIFYCSRVPYNIGSGEVLLPGTLILSVRASVCIYICWCVCVCVRSSSFTFLLRLFKVELKIYYTMLSVHGITNEEGYYLRWEWRGNNVTRAPTIVFLTDIYIYIQWYGREDLNKHKRIR